MSISYIIIANTHKAITKYQVLLQALPYILTYVIFNNPIRHHFTPIFLIRKQVQRDYVTCLKPASK